MAADDRAIVPFRWDLTKREQLGGLLDGPPPDYPDGFLDQLRETAAKVMARAGDADLVFVGRSPETMFDYLSGALAGLDRPRSLTLLQMSVRRASTDDLTEAELAPLLGYFRAEKLDPQAIASFGKAVRFVDVVASGGTFRWLVETLREWSERDGADWNVVRSRIGFVGLTERTRSSPNTHRWQQSAQWREVGQGIYVKNVSISWALWCQLASGSPKVTPSHWSRYWNDPEVERPFRHEQAHMALRGAVRLLETGASRDERLRLARLLAQQPEMRESWLRSLIVDLKATAGRGIR